MPYTGFYADMRNCRILRQAGPVTDLPLDLETMASLPGGWDLAHAIRLEIKSFAELGANSEALSGSQVDSPCSCRAIFEIGPGNDATVSGSLPEYRRRGSARAA